MRRIILAIIALSLALPCYGQDFMYFKKKAGAGGGGGGGTLLAGDNTVVTTRTWYGGSNTCSIQQRYTATVSGKLTKGYSRLAANTGNQAKMCVWDNNWVLLEVSNTVAISTEQDYEFTFAGTYDIESGVPYYLGTIGNNYIDRYTDNASWVAGSGSNNFTTPTNITANDQSANAGNLKTWITN